MNHHLAVFGYLAMLILSILLIVAWTGWVLPSMSKPTKRNEDSNDDG